MTAILPSIELLITILRLSRAALQRVVARLFEKFVGLAGDLGLEDGLDPIAGRNVLDRDRDGFVAAFQDGDDVLGDRAGELRLVLIGAARIKLYAYMRHQDLPFSGVTGAR